MQWMNLNTTLIRSAEYIGSEPTARATWFNLLAYCCEQENYGVISNGAKWKDRQWQQACGVTLDEVNSAAPLITVDGADIVVWGFPSKMLDRAKARRAASAENGKKGGRPPKSKPNGNQGETQNKPTGFSSCNPEQTKEEPTETCNSKVSKDKLSEGNKKQSALDAQDIPTLPDEDLFGLDEPFPDEPPPPDKKIDPPDQRTFADLRIVHPELFVGRDEREDWQRTYAVYGWDCMTVMCQRLTKAGKDRIFLSEAQQWLAKNTEDVE